MVKTKKKYKIYNEITNYGVIAQRYFINNFYDGVLSVLGLVSAVFVQILKDPAQPTYSSAFVIITGLGLSISMFFSGISGSYLSERAELKKMRADLEKAMGVINVKKPEEIDPIKEEKEIQKAMLKPVRLKRERRKKVKPKKVKSLHEKAEDFASLVVSVVNGLAPFLGGIIPLIPFLFVQMAGIETFIMSFVIALTCIVFLGVFLGRLSRESIAKNILQMLIAFSLTTVVIILFLG